MTEAELIKNIKGLRAIKPNQEWVFLTKRRIIGNEEERSGMVYRLSDYFRFLTYKPVIAAVSVIACFGLIFGTFTAAQNSLPGDFLFPVKKIAEKGQRLFISKDKLAQYQFDQTNKRLNEVVIIAKSNQVQKISSAINELKEVTKNLKAVKDGVKAEETEKVLVNKDEAVKALGIMVADNEELNSAVKILVEREIKDLDNRTMTDGQAKLLESAKQNFSVGEYIEALEEIWLISNQATDQE